MSTDDEGVTLPEVNRNVIELRRQVEAFGANYVTVKLWEDNRLDVGRRIGVIENELAERRTAFTNSFLYPLAIAIIAVGITYMVTRSIYIPHSK